MARRSALLRFATLAGCVLLAGVSSASASGGTGSPRLAMLQQETDVRSEWGLETDHSYLAGLAARSDLQFSSFGIHVTPEEARDLDRRWRISAKMGAAMTYCRRVLERAYTGAYVDQRRRGEVVIRGTAPAFDLGPVRALLPPGTDVVYRPSTYGGQQLRALQAAIEGDFRRLAREGILVTAVGSSVVSGRVEITVSPDSRPDAASILSSRYGDAVRTAREEASHSMETTRTTVKSGSASVGRNDREPG